MGNIRLITGATDNPEEADITPTDDAAIYQSMCGSDGVFHIGKNLKAEIISNNLIKIYDGVLICGGRFARIPQGTNIRVSIKNGISGQKRNTIILAKFNVSGSNDILNIETKDGEPGRIATDPALINGDLYAGAVLKEMPLYRVRLDGINIIGIDCLFNTIETLQTKKTYSKEELHIEDFYKVDAFKCVKKGNTVRLNLSLNTNVQVDVNHVYKINRLPIPMELIPNYIANLHGFSCDAFWGNATELSTFIDMNGYINFSTKIKQAFYKISGEWEVD